MVTNYLESGLLNTPQLAADELSRKNTVMASSINIFVTSDCPLIEFAEEMRRMLRVSFIPDLDTVDDEIFFYRDERLSIEIYRAQDYEDDWDMNFTYYHFQIKIRGIRSRYLEENEKLRDEFANLAFSKLKDTGKYYLMMTHNLDTKLDQFYPIQVAG